MQRLIQLISYLNAVFLVKYRSYNDQTDYSLHFFFCNVLWGSTWFVNMGEQVGLEERGKLHSRNLKFSC